MISEKKPKGLRSAGPKVDGGSQDARKVAAAVLEVLAGGVTPTDAAAALGVSVPRYYILESRALEGMVIGCEPRSKGPGQSAEKAMAIITREQERLKRELARTQALARVSQRAVGLSMARAPKVPDKGGKRRRKPVVRAFRAAERLKASAPLPVVGESPALVDNRQVKVVV